MELGRRVALRAEYRMLIDGSLVTASDGAEIDNVSPATGAVLGAVAAAGGQDMDAAIGAARRAFDAGDWSTNRALRKRCLEQLQNALEAGKELLREELVAEVGGSVLDLLQLDRLALGLGRLALALGAVLRADL